MKPPPRQRTKTHPSAKPASKPQRVSQWSWFEQRRLLRALVNLDQNRELDYTSLAKSVRSRSCSEVTAAVESLKDKVIAFASSELKKKRWEDKSDRKPIEMWTPLASTVAGANQEPISKAFAQVFLISSIEPRTLANSERPHSHRPSDSQLTRTAPPTPLPCSAVRVPSGTVLLPQQRPLTPGGESVTPTSSSPAAAAAPAPSAAAAAAAAAAPAPSAAAAPAPSAAAAPAPSAAAAAAPAPSAAAAPAPSAAAAPAPSAAAAAAAPAPAPAAAAAPAPSAAAAPAPSAAAAPAPSAAAADAQCSSTDASPTTSTEACSSVDFEKIYNFLCTIQRPNKQIELTAMEAAIMLDLLMSLPEELPHLNCKKLREHLNQVFEFLTSPADCSDPTELFRSLREVASGQQGAAASFHRLMEKTSSQLQLVMSQTAREEARSQVALGANRQLAAQANQVTPLASTHLSILSWCRRSCS